MDVDQGVGAELNRSQLNTTGVLIVLLRFNASRLCQRIDGFDDAALGRTCGESKRLHTFRAMDREMGPYR